MSRLQRPVHFGGYAGPMDAPPSGDVLEGEVVGGDVRAPDTVRVDLAPAAKGLGTLILGTVVGAVAGYFLNPMIEGVLDDLTGRSDSVEMDVEE